MAALRDDKDLANRTVNGEENVKTEDKKESIIDGSKKNKLNSSTLENIVETMKRNIASSLSSTGKDKTKSAEDTINVAKSIEDSTKSTEDMTECSAGLLDASLEFSTSSPGFVVLASLLTILSSVHLTTLIVSSALLVLSFPVELREEAILRFIVSTIFSRVEEFNLFFLLPSIMDSFLSSVLTFSSPLTVRLARSLSSLRAAITWTQVSGDR